MAAVRMYSTASCSFCTLAERLLRARGVADIEKIRVDLDPAVFESAQRKIAGRVVGPDAGPAR